MSAQRILFVDDEPALLDGVRRLLHKQYDLAFARSADEALAILASEGPFAVVCADMRMPGRSGVELLEVVAERHPETVRLMLSGNADQGTAVDAINRGRIFTFLNKPATREALTGALDAALRLHALERAEKELLERTLAGAIQTLVEILSLALPEQFGRAQRVRMLIREHAAAFGGNAWVLDMAAMLAPIGWATVPAEIAGKLLHGIRLTGEEDLMARRVGETGGRLIANIPRLEAVGQAVRYAGKGYDGSGYPDDAVLGEALPIEARVLRLASALVDASSGEPVTRETLERLRPRAAEFDGALVARLHSALDGTAAAVPVASAPVEQDVEITRVDMLQVGDRLLGDLVLADGTLALVRGTTISDLLSEKLANLVRVRRFRLPIQVRRRASRPAQPRAA